MFVPSPASAGIWPLCSMSGWSNTKDALPLSPPHAPGTSCSNVSYTMFSWSMSPVVTALPNALVASLQSSDLISQQQLAWLTVPSLLNQRLLALGHCTPQVSLQCPGRSPSLPGLPVLEERPGLFSPILPSPWLVSSSCMTLNIIAI